MSATEDTRTFLDALYGGINSNTAGSILIFTVKSNEQSGERSTPFYWARSAGDALETIAGLEPGVDVYTSVGLLDRAKVNKGRGKAEQVVGLVGFVADLDYGE